MDHEQIAKDYLFTDVAIKNMQLDMQRIIDSHKIKIKEPYMHIIDKMISRAINERRLLRQLMYQHKIRIEFKVSHGDFTSYTLYTNGAEKEITFSKEVIKKHVRDLMMNLAKTPLH